jgi:hypothetical protein
MMTRNAVAPFAAMVVSSAAGAVGPIETNSMTPLAAWNGMTIALSQLLINSDRRAAMRNPGEMQAIQQQTTS